MCPYWQTLLSPLNKHIPLLHLLDSKCAGELENVCAIKLLEPLMIIANRYLRKIQYLTRLLLIRFKILDHLLFGQWLSKCISSGRVPDHCGEAPDKENDFMAGSGKGLKFS